MAGEARAPLGGGGAATRPIAALRLICLLLPGVVAAGASGPVHAATGGDPRDQPYLSTIFNQALETERTKVEIPWSNPETGNRGSLVIDRTWYRDPQTPCRDYRWTLERAGHPAETISGTGCRIGPAVWRLDEGASASPALTSTEPAAASPVPAPAPAKSDAAAATPAPSPAASSPKAAPATRSTKAQAAPKAPAPASKPATSAATGSEPPRLPSYTLPSKTAM